MAASLAEVSPSGRVALPDSAMSLLTSKGLLGGSPSSSGSGLTPVSSAGLNRLMMGFQRTPSRTGAPTGTASPIPLTADGIAKLISAGLAAPGQIAGAFGTKLPGSVADPLGDLSTLSSGLRSAISAARNFTSGRPAQGATDVLSTAGSALKLAPKLLPLSADATKLVQKAGAGLGAVGGLASLGLGLATRKGDLTPGEAGGYIQGGLTGAQGAASLAGAAPLAAGLGEAAPMVAAAQGTVEGLGNLFGSGEGQMYDPAVNKALGAVQLVGAAAAPFTFGLSALAAPVISLIGEKLGMYEPTHYNALRMRQTKVGQRALQEVAGGYQTAAKSGDPAQALTALQRGAGDVKGQARLPVRSALSPAVAKEIGVASGDFTQMSQDDYKKVLDYFAKDPSKLTVEPGKEMGGKGAEFGAIQGSGDVAYLDQQAAEQLQHSVGGAAQDLIRSQLLQLYPPGTSPKLDEVRAVLAFKSLTPEQVAALPPQTQQRVKAADPNFDPWASPNPLTEWVATGEKAPERYAQGLIAQATQGWRSNQGSPTASKPDAIKAMLAQFGDRLTKDDAEKLLAGYQPFTGTQWGGGLNY